MQTPIPFNNTVHRGSLLSLVQMRHLPRERVLAILQRNSLNILCAYIKSRIFIVLRVGACKFTDGSKRFAASHCRASAVGPLPYLGRVERSRAAEARAANGHPTAGGLFRRVVTAYATKGVCPSVFVGVCVAQPNRGVGSLPFRSSLLPGKH